jgi:hypothetical protein
MSVFAEANPSFCKGLASEKEARDTEVMEALDDGYSRGR